MTRARDVANLIGSGNYSSTTFTATAGQTVFSIAHTQNFVQVFMNGLLLDLTVDYTSNGSAVTLTSGAAAGDEIEVVAYNTFSVGDALNQAAADTRYVNTAGGSMTGALSISSQNSKLNASSNHLILHDTAETDTGSNWWYMYRASGDGALRFYKGADRLKIKASALQVWMMAISRSLCRRLAIWRKNRALSSVEIFSLITVSCKLRINPAKSE